MTGHNVGPLTVPHCTIFLHRTACVYSERSCNRELLGFAPSNLAVASSRVFASSYTSSKQGAPCTLQPDPWFCAKLAVPLFSSPLLSWLDAAVWSGSRIKAVQGGADSRFRCAVRGRVYAAHVANHFGVKAPSWGSSSADVSSSGCPSVSSTASCLPPPLPPPPPPPTSPPDSSAPDSPPR